MDEPGNSRRIRAAIGDLSAFYMGADVSIDRPTTIAIETQHLKGAERRSCVGRRLCCTGSNIVNRWHRIDGSTDVLGS